MTTAAKPHAIRGFLVACPACGEKDSLHVKLCDVCTLQCDECDMEMTVEELRRKIAGWVAMLDWLESAPLLAE